MGPYGLCLAEKYNVKVKTIFTVLLDQCFDMLRATGVFFPIRLSSAFLTSGLMKSLLANILLSGKVKSYSVDESEVVIC